MARAPGNDRSVPPEDGHHRYPVGPALRPFVYRIGGFEHAGGVVVHRELPLVGTPLILTFGAPYQLSAAANPDEPVTTLPAFVAGPHHRYSTSRATGPNWSIQVDLTPIGAYRMLGLPIDELTDRIERIEDVIGADATRLIDDLGAAVAWGTRSALVDAFLRRRVQRGRPATPGVAWAWQQLAGSHGELPISELSGELGWSRRHFAERFRHELGLSPKTVARQLRFSHAAALLQRPIAGSLADIATGCGYSDQAHLTREFRELAGITPAAFRRERQAPEGIVG